MGIAAFLGLTAPAAAQNDLVSVFGEQTDEGGYAFYATSRHMIPTYVTVSFESLRNLEADVDLPFSTALEPGQERLRLFELSVKNPSRSRGYRLAWSYARGNPETARHDDSHAYLFPFAHGTKHKVTQGFQGDFTHFGANEYGVDFDLDRGTEIYAARGGLVVEVKENSTRGGPSAAYGDDANYVLIYHEDGSFGNYAHLRRGGAAVEPGDRVEAGELIGYSGATGRASGPHLHFDVRLPQPDGSMKSIPIRFRRHDGSTAEPVEGRHYYASHPGGPDFEMEFGRNITNADYEGYSASVEQTRQVGFRTEQVDSTFIAFVVNGYDREITLQVGVTMQGMTSTKETPIRITVPPLTERFLTILRAKPGVARARYGFNARSVPNSSR
jgi:murein DD-endopeptidase MepM/ murein hydrolase activator NlpD